MKAWGLLLAFALNAFASGGENLTTSWVGILSLIIFVVGYYIIAAEEKYHINKAKPALFIGTLIFMLIGLYFSLHGMDEAPLAHEVDKLILEIAEIFFFLMVAMTYIETLINRNVFNALKYSLVSKGYSYKKLFWLTGILAFFISPIADNLTTALILSTVLITIEKERREFLVPGAINIVVAANAGGAWSPFGDITTLMAWTAEKAGFVDFFYLFVPAFFGWLLTAWLLSLFVPKDKPHFDPTTEHKELIYDGGKVVMILGILTITSAVLAHQFFHLPAMWGMIFGLSLLKLYSYKLKKRNHIELNIFQSISKIEHDTLLFFVGILAAVGGLHFLGFLDLAAKLYGIVGPDAVNIGVGFLSAVVDNVPVMSAVLKSNPDMGMDQWLLVTMTAGIGGSLISFGSAAGVGVMGKLRGIYTFTAHMKYAWTILIGYIVSIVIWYIQFEVLKQF
ncbi:sodium:proton antiporter NhaD [Sulfurospirillum sp. 1612]|uniref:sodium:proton antiporter NhaD n=1 Tax=Sulfurospirillum sp. 1612 TaxID=3094835 RepID=UPI002F93B316